jgi:dihydrofolate reductase
MQGPSRIEGYAIVSADGMLAGANRHIPPTLVVEADQKFFQAGLDSAAVVVHGRHSHEGGPSADRRYRLIVTSKVGPPEPATTRPKALLWNPQAASLAEAWAKLGAPDGALAVIGGPEVYALFLDLGYDAFHLSRVADVHIPGGRPVFPEIGPGRSPEDVMASRGLKPGPERVLDAARGATLVTWHR